jgi:uncharacterized NAD-dependent epimerase/dehydratase family protein
LKVIIYAEGAFDGPYSKMAQGILRFSQYEIVAIIDSGLAGKIARDIYMDIDSNVPILESIEASLSLQAETMIIGIAPKGGEMPRTWRKDICFAIEQGLSIYSGLHTMISDDDEFSSLAAKHSVKLWDARKVPMQFPIGMGRTCQLKGKIILTVGTDCKIGKMTTAIMMVDALKRRNKKVVFIPTGQIGVIISGYGLAIDRVIGDFMAGAVEQLILEYGKDADYIVVEGQGSLFHLGYSAVTLGILHGALPDAMILCHEPQRTFISESKRPIPPLDLAISTYENSIRYFKQTKVVGMALNCRGLNSHQRTKTISEIQTATQLPTTDPVILGVENLIDSII